MIYDVDIRQNHANLHERLVFREQSQFDHVRNPRLLKICEMFRIVHMSLRIEIPVTDFGWVKEFEISHGKNYTVDLRVLKDDYYHGGIILHMLPDLQLKDHLRLRKLHPCGSYEWTVVRLGADIGLECNVCQHRVLLTRRELAKRMKANLTKREENKNEQ